MGFWGTVGAGSALLGVNSALGVGQTFLGDWLGDTNREDQALLDWNFYKKKSELDWDYYSNFYAPLNQQLQQEMFDYTSAGNYDRSISYIGDSLEAQKAALSANGYNPILAVNGGAAVHPGNVTGSVGSGLTPHSASGVNANAANPNVNIRGLSLQDLANLSVSAKQVDLMDAQQKEIQAKTLKVIEETKNPGMAGDTVRMLENVVRKLGDDITDTWHSAVDFLRNHFNPVKELHYHNHTGPNWEYDKSLRKSIFVPDTN